MVLALGGVGCASSTVEEELSTGSTSVVHGTNDLVPVSRSGDNVAPRYRPLLDAIGQVGPATCTATHLGDGIAITAGHCFRATQERADDLPCVSRVGSPVSIQWGRRGDLDEAVPTLVSACTRILSLTFLEEGLDYAIISVSPAPSASVPFTLERPAAGRELTLFSHPQGRPLEWSGICALMPHATTPVVFQHLCDTEKGSSGAAILDDEQLAIVGIHNGGRAGRYNYATYLSDTPLAEFVGGDDGGGGGGGGGGGDDGFANHEYFGETVTAGQRMTFGPYDVPGRFEVAMTGDGDADLYVRRGSPATTTAYDCRPYQDTSEEACSMTVPGHYYLTVSGYAPVSNFAIEARY